MGEKRFFPRPKIININQSTIGYIEGVLSVIINTVLFGLKYWVGIATGSVAIIADAWHTLSDTLTSLVVILGFKVSSVPPDREHPFGHGRAEVISAIIIGTLLAMVGFNFLVESIERFGNRQAADFNRSALIVFVVSVLVKEGIAQFSLWAGKKFDARSLTADGWHHRSDAIASVLIIAGIFLGKRFWWIDSVMGIIVSLLIFWATFDIMKDAVSTLFGEEPDAGFKKQVQAVIRNTIPAGVQSHHFHLHAYGHHKELTFHIELDPGMKLKEAHDIADRLERAIREEMNVEATIHVDPIE